MKRTILYLGCAIMAALSACTDDMERESPEPTTVGISEVTNLTPKFIGTVTGVKAGDKFEKGGIIALVLTPGEILVSGFEATHMEHIHIHVGDKVYMPSFPETSDECIQSLSMEIPVPETSTGIVVAYSVQQQLDTDGFTMKLEDNADGIVLYGVSPEMKYKYFDCYLRTPDAYTIETVEYKMGEDEWKEINSIPGCKFARSESLDWVYVVSVRPQYQNVSADIALRVTGSQHARYKIVWNNTEFIRTDLPEGYQPNILPTESIDGEEVAASFWTKEGYYLSGVSANIAGLEPECRNRSSVRFTMPASDVVIDLDFKEMIPVNYKLGAHVTDARIYDDKDIYYGVPTDIAIPGEYVYLFANAEEGYKPSAAINDKGESFKFVLYGEGVDKYAWYAPVMIPEDAVSASIKAEVVKAYTVSGETGTIYFPQGTLWAESEEVAFQVVYPSGKTLKEVSVRQPDGTPVECTMNDMYGSFVMPASDVHVSALFEDIVIGTQAHISALYDTDQYTVYCQTIPYYQEITEEGFEVPAGTALYINITEGYGMPFHVGVKIGDNATYHEAQTDPDSGEASFGKSFTINADTQIKVGESRESVQF